jgi:hypothetical protein
MSIGDAMRALDLADDQIHKAGRNLTPAMESGEFPPHLYMEVLRLREELRDLEAKIGEHVMAVAGETEHA